MRIIKNPNPVDGEIGTCPRCECEFEFNEGDIHEESWDNGVLGPGHQGYHKKGVYCPNCGLFLSLLPPEQPEPSIDFREISEEDMAESLRELLKNQQEKGLTKVNQESAKIIDFGTGEEIHGKD